MGTPRVRIKDTDKGMKAFKERMKQLHKASVTTGVHEGAGAYTDDSGKTTPVVDVAFWNEFGTENIPERSFVRSAYEENSPKIHAEIKKQKDEVVKGKSVTKALSSLGFMMMTFIKNKILSNIPPPNEPSTLARKAGTKTLVDSRLLLRSINYEVHD